MKKLLAVLLALSLVLALAVTAFAAETVIYENSDGETFAAEGSYLDPWGGFGIASNVNGNQVGEALTVNDIRDWAKAGDVTLGIEFYAENYYGGAPSPEVQFNCWDSEDALQVKFELNPLGGNMYEGTVAISTLLAKLEALGKTVDDINNMGVQVWASNFRLYKAWIETPEPEVIVRTIANYDFEDGLVPSNWEQHWGGKNFEAVDGALRVERTAGNSYYAAGFKVGDLQAGYKYTVTADVWSDDANYSNATPKMFVGFTADNFDGTVHEKSVQNITVDGTKTTFTFTFTPTADLSNVWLTFKQDEWNGSGVDHFVDNVVITETSPKPESDDAEGKYSAYLSTGDEYHMIMINGAVITTPHEFGEDNTCIYCGQVGEDVVIIEVTDPVESTTDEEEDVTADDEVVTEEEPAVEENPKTGLALAIVPMILAAAAVVISKR